MPTTPWPEAAWRRRSEECSVGRWTVEMMLIFRLGRPDVLPATDYGIQKGFALAKRLADLPKPKELLTAGECWAPHRTVAAWYLWRTADTATL